MLAEVKIEQFRSYRKASLKLGPLTVLIGANAAGKSNALEAVRLLSWIASGNRLSAIRHALQDTDRTIRGRISDLGFRQGRSFSLACETTDVSWGSYSVRLDVREGDELHISDERVTGGYSSWAPLFEVITPSKGALGDMSVAYNNFARGGRKPQIVCSDQMAVLCQLMSSARFYPGHKKAQTTIPAVTRRIHHQLSTITFLDPRPSLMRGYSFKSEQRLTETGGNLSGVLHNLCQREGAREQVLELVRALPEQDIQEIDFIETPRGEVMVALTETFGGHATRYDATLLSDGTLRVLAIAAAILSAPGGLVVIEEIDNGVHPSRAGRILHRVSRIAKERDLRVLISSHNPALLDALPDDAVPHVVFCYRDPDDGSSRLIRLDDVADYPELIAQGPVGHLLTRGILDRFVKEHPGPEQRKQRAQAWLHELRNQVDGADGSGADDLHAANRHR
ncbi:MAG: ATP-binding protein [Acidobacteria bacterium]|nr:ATP-binding protein [Acidobacteriota bacterium]